MEDDRTISPVAKSFDDFLNQFAKDPEDDDDEAAESWETLVEAGDRKGVSLWLKQGGRLDQTGSEGMPPLQLAIHNDQYPIVELLLDHGASAEEALEMAVMYDQRWEIARSLLKKAGKLKISPKVFSHALQSCNDPSVIEAMLKAGAPIHAEEFGHNPLHYATVFNANPRIVKLLLEHGARLDETGDSPGALAFAITLGQLETVKLLLDAGADLYADPQKKTKQGDPT